MSHLHRRQAVVLLPNTNKNKEANNTRLSTGNVSSPPLGIPPTPSPSPPLRPGSESQRASFSTARSCVWTLCNCRHRRRVRCTCLSSTSNNNGNRPSQPTQTTSSTTKSTIDHHRRPSPLTTNHQPPQPLVSIAERQSLRRRDKNTARLK
jgi:hypothetical protein